MRNTILFLCLLFTLPCFSQWEADLKKTISWYQVSPTGNLILATNDGIVGINESNGQLLYTIPNETSVLEEEFQVIPNTPFGMISRMEGRLQSKMIFKLTDGKVLFDSKKEGISIGKQYLLGSTGDFIFQGIRGTESVFFLVDISTGTIRWEQINLFGKGMFAEVIDGAPIENEDGNFIIPTVGGMSGGSIYCFSPKDGKQQWKAELPKLKGAQTATQTATKLATSFLENDKFIYMRGQSVMAYNIKNGQTMWSEPAKQRGLPDQVIYDPFGLIVASAVDPNNTVFKPTMVMYDYKTGKEIWPEQVKLKGTVTSYSYCDNGLLISMDAGNGKSLINIVDIDKGVYLFENGYKVNGLVQEMQLLGSAVYVRTNLEEDFVSIENGQSLLTKNISSKLEQPLINVRSGDLSFTFNPADDILYKTDLSKQTQIALSAGKIDFDQNETPERIGILNDEVVLSSSQTIAAFDFNGNELFKTHIPAPGISGWKKAIYATSAVLLTMDAMRYAELEVQANKASSMSKTAGERQLCDAIGQFANNGANVRISAAASDMEKMRTRFKASASGNTVQFVLGKLESKEYGLFGISKETGAKVSEINFGKDNDPKYLLDDVSRIVYYLDDNGVLKSIVY
ncbi:MAG: PQQ-binding-like beta-propeller repeat protein [Flavobacteriales bacterium]|jgi:outer membrane protein assembly factor BamB